MPATNLPAPGPRKAQPAVAPTAPFYVSREEIARAIPVSPRTIDEWRIKGWIPYLKIGGVVRFDLKEVKAALERRFKVKANADGKTKN
jgi:excisionase family DNA binding protein